MLQKPCKMRYLAQTIVKCTWVIGQIGPNVRDVGRWRLRTWKHGIIWNQVIFPRHQVIKLKQLKCGPRVGLAVSQMEAVVLATGQREPSFVQRRSRAELLGARSCWRLSQTFACWGICWIIWVSTLFHRPKLSRWFVQMEAFVEKRPKDPSEQSHSRISRPCCKLCLPRALSLL